MNVKHLLLFLFVPFGLLTARQCVHDPGHSSRPDPVAPHYDSSKIEKIAELIEKYAAYGKFSGSVLIAEKGEVIFKKGFGFANMEWGVPNQPDTKHRLASMTKQFTAMLILQLVAEGKLKLDVPISTYLPAYPQKNGDRITIHHLLTHSSGIPEFTSFPNFFKDRNRDPHTPAELVSLFADSALQFTPGENFIYSNSGYILLGFIIENVTGKSYEQVLQEKILTPLKMNHSGVDQYGTLLPNRAAGYVKFGGKYRNAPYLDMSIPYAAGAMYSTVEDLYLWDQALYTEKLLPKNYRELLFDSYIPASPTAYYGYGWFMDKMRIGNTNEQLQTISHGGNINGFSTLITRIPSDKSFIVLLGNTGGAPLRDMTIAITGILHGKPYNLPKKSIAYAVLDVMEEEGITPALSYYQAVQDSSGYYLNEGEINEVGYIFLQSNRPAEAAAIFKLNVDAFPHSSNVYDSYGEALLALGNKTAAIENYQKSVELNPGNMGGRKVLNDLGVNTDTLIKKVPVEHLRLLAGEYVATNHSPEWKVIFEVVNGALVGNDRGYRFNLVAVGNDKFVNPQDGATCEFDAQDKNAIRVVIFGTLEFRKVK